VSEQYGRGSEDRGDRRTRRNDRLLGRRRRCRSARPCSPEVRRCGRDGIDRSCGAGIRDAPGPPVRPRHLRVRSDSGDLAPRVLHALTLVARSRRLRAYDWERPAAGGSRPQNGC